MDIFLNVRGISETISKCVEEMHYIKENNLIYNEIISVKINRRFNKTSTSIT